MKRWRLTRVTRTHVWIRPMHYGWNPPRGCSRRIAIETFREEWVRLPQREVMRKENVQLTNGEITDKVDNV